MVEGAGELEEVGVGVEESASRSFSSSPGRCASLLGEYKMLLWRVVRVSLAAGDAIAADSERDLTDEPAQCEAARRSGRSFSFAAYSSVHVLNTDAGW